jgi:hypothetical protein
MDKAAPDQVFTGLGKRAADHSDEQGVRVFTGPQAMEELKYWHGCMKHKHRKLDLDMEIITRMIGDM